MEIVCVNKLYDSLNKENIYILMDDYGIVKEVESKVLKRAIQDGKLTVKNMKIASNGVLRTIGKMQSDYIPAYINKVIEKARILGRPERIIKVNNDKIIDIPITNENHIVYIPYKTKSVTKISNDRDIRLSDFFDTLRNITGKIAIYGGSGLYKTDFMFYNFRANILDLQYLDTSNVHFMNGMFYNSEVKELIMPNIKTDKVVSMETMFKNIEIEKLDLSMFKTSSLLNTTDMFYGAKIGELDLTSFNFKSSDKLQTDDMFIFSEINTLHSGDAIKDIYNRRRS